MGNCFGLNSKKSSNRCNEPTNNRRRNNRTGRYEYQPRVVREKMIGIHNRIARLDV